MKETILISGRNGLLANRFWELQKSNYNIKFLSTDKKKCDNISVFYWNIKNEFIDGNALKDCDHIVHLAGYPIINRWTKENKKKMYESRINSTKLIYKYCKKLMIKPKTFISASAIGIYGLESEGVKDEKDITNTDWISRMAIDWEKSADIFKKINTKVVKMRISLIISKKSLFLKSYLLSMRFGIATLLGSKSRHISWIHIDDAVNFIDLAINNKKYNGAYNLATSKSLTQGKLVQIIKEEKYPFCITFQIPAQILSFVLGKRSKIFIPNLVAKADKLKKLDFKYKYDSFRKVIRSL
tara:strand:+ start:4658 stop:5551 length:894 start_codon:yes stop_codon:yes gene_type:complete